MAGWQWLINILIILLNKLKHVKHVSMFDYLVVRCENKYLNMPRQWTYIISSTLITTF